MVQLNKKGILQLLLHPYVIIAIILVLGLSWAGASIGKLEISEIGFDDYLTYDSFERGYLDDTLWEYQEAPESGVYIDDGTLIVKGTTGCTSGLFTGVKSFDLTTTEVMSGKSIKIKVKTNNAKTLCGGRTSYAYSTATIFINDVEAVTCNKDRTCTFEFIPSFENPSKYLIKLNGEELKVVDTANPSGDGKLKINFFIYAPKDSDGTSGVARFEYVKFKYEYSCKINDDEVLVYDSYTEGSPVNISLLSYEPTKFCLDYPVKARSFVENGIKTDTRGEVLDKIVHGYTVTVPDYEEWKVYYITKWSRGMQTACPLDQALNSITGECDNINERAIIGCEQNSDCYVPAECTGLIGVCEDWSCNYIGACELPKEIVEKIVEVQTVVEKEVVVEKVIEIQNDVEVPVYIEVEKEVEVEKIVEVPIYQDLCQDSTDCPPPCDGITGSCINVNGYNKCDYTGFCTPETIQCTSDAMCPSAPCEGVKSYCNASNMCHYDGKCKQDIEVPEQEIEVFVPDIPDEDKGLFSRIIDWFKSLFS